MFNDKTPPKKILLIATQQIGDVLLATPLLKSMRMAWPDAVIDVLVYRNTSGILMGNSDCNNVIESDNHPTFSAYLKLLKRIFRKYDLAVTTQGNDRAHQYAFLAGKKRVGLIPNLKKKHWWKKLSCMRWSLLDENNTHTVAQNLLLADLMGIERQYALTPPKLGSTDSITRLNQLLNFNLTETTYTIIHPLPMWQYKRWTDSGWIALIQQLLNLGQRVIITGGPAIAEQNYAQQLTEHFVESATGFVTSLAGKTSFAEMSSLLNHAAAYVGPDTATTHLAAACGTPTLAIFGPTNPVKWAPWPLGYHENKSPWQRYFSEYQIVSNVMLLQGRGECVPCHKAGCNDHNNSHSQCLDTLDTKRVIQAFRRLIKIDIEVVSVE
ncbi:glycosyltransferase family 9 protein [Methylotenera sp.]|uniref:glycosyltransferase family 9 protein n=1 Tax=Methylotenera sp. TaxID=2051956 RepID=UPI0024880860|nr:glycosyltransferase family 9 protein [Methylotenera sp.]MDI1297879.1 glycosyltransferase family 9 protein [Methylotenera sp.]